MQELLDFLLALPLELAAIISILLNIGISIVGVVPSAFLTVINIQLFGLTVGVFVSFLGELLGGIVSFWLYRKGFHRFISQKSFNYPRLHQLLNVKGKDAFFLVFTFRLLIFVPSSAVTFFAAVGKMSLVTFLVASTLGKAPALAIETYSTYQILHWTLQGKIILFLLSALLIIIILRKWKTSST
ncbi:TVP38/TMEM64 family protein [Peribacillus alkalitolerans]|uniref:TVP38/TMEM64 family protein n=1 Tax=Peribacillus alkalitolerans TaxID=1550385 RepID=UPI0013D63C3C|nr:VTT domain-containing protein [Peribacillus alkalitolerans]